MTRFLSKPRPGGAANADSADARPRGGAKALAAGAAVVALGLGLAACGGSDSDASSGDGSGGTIDLVAYSTPQTAYEESIEPAFSETLGRLRGRLPELVRRLRRPVPRGRGRPAGRRRAPAAGAGHDPSGRGRPDRRQDYTDTEYNGGTQNSVVVFVTRPGNPEGIDSWDDLVTGEVEVITPNPFTSGGARWNLMAAYGSQIEQGKSEEEALAFVQQVLENTPVQDASARDALQTFIGGKGDVLLSYENEAIGAIDAGEELDYVVPDETILIETQAAVTDRGRRSRGRPGVPRLPDLRRGSAALGRERLPPGEREDPRRVLG